MTLVRDRSVTDVSPRRAFGRRLLALGGAALLCVAATACREAAGERARYVPGEAAAVLGVATDSLRPAIASRLERGTPPGWVTPARWKKMRALYRTFGDAPLWLESDGVKDRAGALLRAIERAPEDGLSMAAYPVDSIRRIVEGSTRRDAPSAQELANADVMLTSAYVAYAADMLRGQVDPRSVSQEWHIGSQGQELDSALVHGIQSTSMDTALGTMVPQDADYQLLKQGYARYQQVAAAGGWPTVAAGPALRRGATSTPARLDALRARLQAEGYLTEGDTTSGNVAAPSQSTVAPPVAPVAPASRYDAALAGAVARFQKRHGFAPDSVLREATVRALNVPAAYRAKQMAANLERHRWLPRALGMRYIYVNVPSFRLDAYDGGQQVLTMRVVVGDEYAEKATPAFSDSLETVVFRPYWNITDDIAAKETWPKIRADPDYLSRNDMETFQEGGTTRLRQRPGDKNSLGLVKFLFPNSYNIYLHDTPDKSLFAKADRAASHGCIRLQHPDQLAQLVLGWSADSVRQMMTMGTDNHAVRLSTKIPVYIVYFTAYGRDGQLHFADDLYGRDDALEQRLAGAADRVALAGRDTAASSAPPASGQ
jgi:murein L,D-transpeptidase YcbB/YkuD